MATSKSKVERDWIRIGNIALQVFVGVCSFLIVLAVSFPILASMFMPRRGNRYLSLSNIKQCGLAALIYANDFDDRFPRADRWVDETFHYVRKESIYDDPDLKQPGSSGYGFRDRASSVDTKTITDPNKFIILFTTVLKGRNAHGDLDSMPNPGRGANQYNCVGFSDGHAKRVLCTVSAPSIKPVWLIDDAKSGPMKPRVVHPK